MNSKTTDRFWKCYSKLPSEIKKRTKAVYQLFIDNPYHPSLHFKRIHANRPIFSIRVTKTYRALGVLQDDDIIWFWIGSHKDYDELLKQLQSN